MIGEKICHYRIIEKLGEGGMGVVYKAEDLKLTRIVALKFLPQALHANESERARFLQEARAAAILNHPNICTVYDIQEYDGEQFIVMEYVEGVTLKKRIQEGAGSHGPGIRKEQAIDYAIQIGEALQEAHGRGIVHRDVKAENIMVNSKNQIKVMDFGLAKLKGSLKLTQTSSTVGTLAYMAPEHLHGGEVDARSDIFSFGALLFEMLTGRTPFRGEHEAAIMYSIVNEPPDSLLKYRPDLPSEFERIVYRALEKDPEDRYQHADDMVSELRRLNKQSSRISRASLPTMASPDTIRPSPASQEFRTTPPVPVGSRRAFLGIGIVIAVAILGVIGYVLFFSPRNSIDSLAVLPFVNVSHDPNTEYLSDGITESLINALSQLPDLTVMSRSSVFHYKGREVDPQEIGRQLGVKAVLTGRLMQQGQNLIISAELVNVANNSHMWGGRYNRSLSDLVSVQDELSKEISGNLGATLGVEEAKQLSKRPTESSNAYQAYLRGKFHWNKRRADDLRKAIDYFNQAIEIDSNYALAYAGLASTYVVMPQYAGVQPSEVIPKIEAAAQKAINLDPTLAEPRAVLGLVKQSFQWDWEGAEKEFKRAIELNPNYPTSHHWYSICLRQQGKIEQALDEIRRAQELDPLSPVIIQNIAEIYMAMHRYDEAFDQSRKMLELDPNFIGAHLDLGYLYVHENKFEDAIREFEKVRQIVGPDHPYAFGILGYTYARAGKGDQAMKILRQLQGFSERGFVLSSEAAMIYTGLGDKGKAFEWLDRAVQEHDQPLGFIKTAGVWESLRSDPRYAILLEKMNLGK